MYHLIQSNFQACYNVYIAENECSPHLSSSCISVYGIKQDKYNTDFSTFTCLINDIKPLVRVIGCQGDSFSEIFCSAVFVVVVSHLE